MNDRIDEPYGLYRIVAGIANQMPQGYAYLGSRPIFRLEGESPGAVAAALKEKLDDQRTRQRAQRIDGVPTAAEYGEALLGLMPGLDAETLAQLRHHVRTDIGVTIDILARLTRQSDLDVLRRYAKLGRALARVLGFSPSAQSLPKEARPICSFAILSDTAGSWRLRDEARAGFLRWLDTHASP